MLDVEVIEKPDTRRGRSGLFGGLIVPLSGAALAKKVGMPRQKVNYHLRLLEEQGLITVAEERKWGGLTERMLVAGVPQASLCRTLISLRFPAPFLLLRSGGCASYAASCRFIFPLSS